MILSRCCKENVFILIDYYVCEKCHRSCDTLFSMDFMSESQDDARDDSKA